MKKARILAIIEEFSNLPFLIFIYVTVILNYVQFKIVKYS